jgi:hypothetical protein
MWSEGSMGYPSFHVALEHRQGREMEREVMEWIRIGLDRTAEFGITFEAMGTGSDTTEVATEAALEATWVATDATGAAARAATDATAAAAWAATGVTVPVRKLGSGYE